MKNKKIYFIAGLIILLAGGFWNMQRVSDGEINGQNIFTSSNNPLTSFQKRIVQKIRDGDVTGLVEYFGEEVSITILDKDDFYSNQEAENILLEFCQNHKTKKFFVKHHGANSNHNNYFLIGELITTENEKFRVFISNNEKQIETIEIKKPLNL